MENEVIWPVILRKQAICVEACLSVLRARKQWVQRGTMYGRRNAWRARFNGLNVVYDKEGYYYPIDNEGRIYVALDLQTVSKVDDQENDGEETNN